MRMNKMLVVCNKHAVNLYWFLINFFLFCPFHFTTSSLDIERASIKATVLKYEKKSNYETWCILV